VATILQAMLSGPMIAPLAIGAVVGIAPWAMSAYGIYRVLKDVFEGGESKTAKEQDPPPASRSHTEEG
jgi:hypothetical protein